MKTNREFFSIVLIIGLISVIFTGCKKKESPGPISVEDSITPSSVANGNSIEWDINITNSGSVVRIDSIHVKEEFISGWAQGTGTVEMNLPSFDNSVAAHKTETVFSVTGAVVNTGDTDVDVKNTVTAYSNGGSATDYTIYTITMDKKKSGTINSITRLIDLIVK
jgi:hypothetical protein